jgi:hypothetical protein
VFLCHPQHSNFLDYVASPFLGAGLSPLASLTLTKGNVTDLLASRRWRACSDLCSFMSRDVIS